MEAEIFGETPGILKMTAIKTGGTWFILHVAAEVIFLKCKSRSILGLLRNLQ